MVTYPLSFVGTIRTQTPDPFPQPCPACTVPKTSPQKRIQGAWGPPPPAQKKILFPRLSPVKLFDGQS